MQGKLLKKPTIGEYSFVYINPNNIIIRQMQYIYITALIVFIVTIQAM